MSEAPRPRDVMPEVWKRIGRFRQEYGDAHVSECIRRGMQGEADWFYAFEAGHVVGTPFKAESLQRYVNTAVMLGGRFAIVMRPPAGKGADGAH